jgi:hypothetical protein
MGLHLLMLQLYLSEEAVSSIPCHKEVWNA